MTEIVARLAPGATLEQARTEVAAVSARVQKEFSEAYDPGSHHRITVTPFQEVLGERARLTLWLLMGAAAFVMIGGGFPALIKQARESGLPVVASNTGYEGAPISLGASFYDNGYAQGQLMIRVLRGESPANIPFRTSAIPKMVVNLGAAADFAVTIPDNVIKRASVVIPVKRDSAGVVSTKSPARAANLAAAPCLRLTMSELCERRAPNSPTFRTRNGAISGRWFVPRVLNLVVTSFARDIPRRAFISSSPVSFDFTTTARVASSCAASTTRTAG